MGLQIGIALSIWLGKMSFMPFLLFERRAGVSSTFRSGIWHLLVALNWSSPQTLPSGMSIESVGDCLTPER